MGKKEETRVLLREDIRKRGPGISFLERKEEVVSSDISRNFSTAAIDPDTRRTHASASLIKFTRP